MKKPFWRDLPLNEREEALLADVMEAHEASTGRNNISSVTAVNAFAGSRSFTQAVAAALCTLGEHHGPVLDAYEVFYSRRGAENVVLTLLSHKRNVPGFGNSFHKGVPDPLWVKVRENLETHFPESFRHVQIAQDTLWSVQKKLFPNPAAFTAAAAHALGIPPHLGVWLFIAGRLDGWAKLVLDY